MNLNLSEVPPHFLTRKAKQLFHHTWCKEVFGPEHVLDKRVRALRLLEEAIELFQSVGGKAEQATNLVNYVFSRPPGNPIQELGGVSTCMLVLAQTLGTTVEEAEDLELRRVWSKFAEHFQARNRTKENVTDLITCLMLLLMATAFIIGDTD